MEDTEITPDMIVFPQTIHGAWVVNVSIYEQTQILIIARSRIRGNTICEFFYRPEEAAEFIEFLDLNEGYYE